MSATAAFAEQLDALGIWWPRGDGDALRSAAQAWETIADYLDDTDATLDQATRRVLDDHRGSSAEAFADLWHEWSGAEGYLGQTATDCRRLCLALVDFASDIDAADRTIVRLIELALASVTASGSGGATLLDLDEAWRRWLDDAIGSVGSNLAVGAERTAAMARSVNGRLAPRSPDAAAGSASSDAASIPVDLSEPSDATLGGPSTTGSSSGVGVGVGVGRIDLDLIDPDAIDWVDPGTPDDLTHLVTDEVDFGAGQGVVPVIGAPVTPPPTTPWPPTWSPDWPTGTPPGWPMDPTTGLPLPWPGSPNWSPTPGTPGWPGSGGDDGPITITVNGDGATVTVGDGNNVTVSAPPTPSPNLPFTPTPTVPLDLEPPEIEPLDAPAALAPPMPAAASGGGAGFGGGGGGGFGGGLSGGSIDLSGIDGPVTAADPFELTELSSDSFVEQLEAPGVDAFVTATPEAVGPTSSSSGGRMPFFPMMPMGGGGAGDDGQEPRRKRMRH